MTFPVPAKWTGVLDAKPKNAFTVEEYAAHCKILYKNAVERLGLMVKAGQIKIGHFRGTDTKGRICVKNFYQNE